MAQWGKNPPAMQETQTEFDPWAEKIPWRRAWQSTLIFLPGESQEPGGLQSIGSKRIRHD